jgi:FemAB-related protein (PEP-CTERM system-associated)
MTFTVERFTGSPAEWDTFVRFADTGTQCHLWGWKSIIERVLGHECIYLAARTQDGRIAGVLPLVRVSSRLFGSYLVSMPFLNYGGALGSDRAVQALVARALELTKSGNIELLEMRSRNPLPVELPVSHRKITVVLDLTPGDPVKVWESLRAKVRSQVRRPQKEGVVVQFGPDQLGPFFGVFSRRMRDLGTPTQSRQFFEALLQMFPAEVWFGCAYDGAQAVAAGCGFRWNGEFEMTWAASLTGYNAVAPNMLLYWAFIERAAQQGLAAFNFGRCTPGSGTHRFKQQWGGRDVPLWWYQHAAGQRAATPSPDDRAFSWGPRVWRRLPLPIANMLGPRVVRLIP